MMAGLLRIALAATLLAAAMPAHAAGALAAHDAWVREAPPGVTVLAAYLVIENSGARTNQLVGVTSPEFGAVEIHATQVRDGVATMTAVPALPVPAHGRAALAPGGYHLMLLRPKHALAAGDRVTLALRFASGATLRVSAPVRRAEAGPAHQH